MLHLLLCGVEFGFKFFAYFNFQIIDFCQLLLQLIFQLFYFLVKLCRTLHRGFS